MKQSRRERLDALRQAQAAIGNEIARQEAKCKWCRGVEAGYLLSCDRCGRWVGHTLSDAEMSDRFCNHVLKSPPAD